MFVIKYKKIFTSISAVLVGLSAVSIIIFGLKPGIDFTGGSQLKLTYTQTRPEIKFIEDSIHNFGFHEALVQPIGEDGVSIKTRTLTDEERESIIYVATHNYTNPAVQESFTTIGPSIGKELTKKAIIATIIVFISIIFFVAYVFRKVSKPVSSWKYGFVVILTLIHDVTIPSGVYAILGEFAGAEVDTLFVVALLTIFALSISDTIVVFDRVRENLTPKEGDEDKEPVFSEVVGRSLSQTYVRSMNTSLLVLATVVCLALFGPESTRLFSIILAIGMFVGTYSSIFLASPLLVVWESLQEKNKQSPNK